MSMKESGEMYLETILLLSYSNAKVRSIDVAAALKVSKPSVSRAMGVLKGEEYITIDDKGYISLTTEGRRVAENVYERHTVLSEALMQIGVDEDTAAEDACKMEHVISEASFEAIKRHMNMNKKM
ncbi:MAG: metal-dependent transcriptional regulator [Lachnospiraceae bacterium]|nr:metal-dependent transcriptional regulator [Candidatus Colinaster equi]